MSNIFHVFGEAMHTFGDLEEVVVQMTAGQTPDFKPFAEDFIHIMKNDAHVKVPKRVTAERLAGALAPVFEMFFVDPDEDEAQEQAPEGGAQ